jgi:hypothetical protein
MALFTESQAKACKITKMKKRTREDAVSWVIGFSDADGNHYEIKLYNLDSDPETSDIKTATIAEIVKMDKRPAKGVQTIEHIEDKGLGETLG